jgi:hypothetical protein
MNRRLRLALNKFQTTPTSLRSDPRVDEPAADVAVNLFGISHHLFLDTHDALPTRDQSTNHPLFQFVTLNPFLRFTANGLGTNTEARRGYSNSYGKAFCRYFLHQHCGITYFAHIDSLIGKEPTKGSGGLTVARIEEGDLPDYLCSTSNGDAYIGEAKGRMRSIGFKNTEFAQWRAQFSRIEVRYPDGRARKTKGYIVATRFASERDSQRVVSKVLIEDPSTPGELIEGADGDNPSAMIVDEHYAAVMSALRLRSIADVLSKGTVLPKELGRRVGVWRTSIPALSQKRFVGGFLPMTNALFDSHREWSMRMWHSVMDLSRPTVLFFGLEESVFNTVLARALERNAIPSAEQLNMLPSGDQLPSDVSVHRDGTVFASIDYFDLDDVRII